MVSEVPSFSDSLARSIGVFHSYSRNSSWCLSDFGLVAEIKLCWEASFMFSLDHRQRHLRIHPTLDQSVSVEHAGVLCQCGIVNLQPSGEAQI